MNDDVLGYLLDTLDPKEQEAIERRIEEDPAFRAEVEAARKLLMPLAEDDCIEPPPGLAEQTFAHARGAVLSLDRSEWSDTRSRMRLIDFIAVASVLFMAAMLVFPSIATIRGDQARVMCAEQLRKLGVALAMYADQESNQLPFVDANGPMNNAGIFAVLLKSRDLIADRQSLICPSANSAVVLLPDVDEYLEAQENPSRVARLRAHMSGSYGYVLGYQEDGAHHGFARRTDSSPVISDRPPRAEESSFSNSPNHQNLGQNVLYADGNVRWLPSRITAGDDLFQNENDGIGAGLGPADIVIGVSESTPYPSVDL